jgi:undecaprenyl-diphosphatase
VMIVGFVTSLVVGYFAIKLLVYVLKNNRLKYFSYYCWAVGLIVLIMQIVNR